MPLFYTKKDIQLFDRINAQIVQNIIDTSVYLLKIVIQNNNQNIYGQTLSKRYQTPLRIPAIIQHQDIDTSNVQYGHQFKQKIIVKFNNNILIKYLANPQLGDIIQYNNNDYQISTIIRNKFIGGNINNNFSTICTCVYTSKSKTQTQEKLLSMKKSIYNT